LHISKGFLGVNFRKIQFGIFILIPVRLLIHLVLFVIFYSTVVFVKGPTLKEKSAYCYINMFR